ncbi:helix-turn-helix transcriptional regulator [Streptomyces griseiscabiei]|uniref:Helix-turn-helix transcriptional regulator n=1 Tax=Streptomyces griseiscabiei TaxID=2993540 RepID=A0ABU4LCH9_9ACTN|nr:helix-turn-helix transcriptional regulator [Streptomyces griseiscabiei]MBZ3907336.1 helix-turn-helix transcriptional regulator [Streptomyces griseiscabiei]MDX2913429.1 helix-turn-helix transcriptional regulator [Streptomyces griseiscabiei]
MKLEKAIGRKLAWARRIRGLSQAQLGEALGAYLEKPWSRQAVNAAERGDRAFTARDLLALALALETPVTTLLIPLGSSDEVELPSGAALDRAQYRSAILHPDAGKTSALAESLEDLKRVHAAFGQMIDLHQRIGLELNMGLDMLASAAEVLGATPENDPGESGDADG